MNSAKLSYAFKNQAVKSETQHHVSAGTLMTMESTCWSSSYSSIYTHEKLERLAGFEDIILAYSYRPAQEFSNTQSPRN